MATNTAESKSATLTRVETKLQVIELIRAHWKEIANFGIERCGVFGSFGRGTDIHDDSDVDILVLFDPKQKTFDNYMNLAFRLEDLFGRDVDLVTVESLSPHIGPHILAEVEYVSRTP
ncbi:MAG: nucleotidyltransferase family protein [Cyanobacteria bacterium J06621_3]